MTTITSTEANRRFSQLLAKVRKGETAEITVRGEVVAELRPVKKKNKAAEVAKKKSWDAFMERLRTQKPVGVPRGAREDLYDDGEQ